MGDACARLRWSLNRLVVPSLLLAALGFLCWWYYDEVIAWFPSHIHAWTQSDRLALTYGYLDNGLNFFLPATYNIYTPNGITGVDFPIHEYIVALIMTALGNNDPVVFRIYTLVYSLVGYLFLYRMALRHTSSALAAATVVIFMFTCPIITYYQAGFIPSATSLANCFIGFYYYLEYRLSRNRIQLYAGLAFITLAALPRLSVNVVLFAVLLTEASDWFRRKKIDWPAVRAFGLSYGAVVIGLAYKTYLNVTYGSRFLARLLPPDDAGDLIGLTATVWHRWSLQLLTRYHWLVLCVAIIALSAAIIRRRLTEQDRPYLTLGALLLAGSLAFYVIMAKQFVDHEYYFMDSLYQGIAIVLVAGLRFVRLDSYVHRMIWPAFFTGAMIGMSVDSAKVQDVKYAETSWDRGEVTRKNFTGAGDFLDDLGVPEDARILVYEAHSTNVPLLLMRRKGYTVLNSHEENIRRALVLDFDLIAIQDQYFASEVASNAPWITDCLRKVGGNGKISLFEKIDCSAVGQGIRPVTELLDLNEPWLVLECITGAGNDSSSTFISNCGEAVDARKTYGPTLVLSAEEISETSIVFVEITYDTGDSTILLPLEFRVESAVTKNDGKVEFQSHPVKVKGRGPGTYYCTFDFRDRKTDARTLKVYVWNRHKINTGIESVRFELYD